MAQTLVATVGRAGELVARYGGEEFVVLLPDHTPEQAQAVAQRIVLAVRDLRIAHAVQEYVTISVGVAAMQPSIDQPQTSAQTSLFEQADQALYMAKQAGRNGCWMYGVPLSASATT